MDKESYWRLLGLTQSGSRLLVVHDLRHYQFASLREAKQALEWAKAAQAEPQQSALAALAMSI